MIDTIVILAATTQELSPLIKLLDLKATSGLDTFSCWRGIVGKYQIIGVKTGVGAKFAGLACASAINQTSPKVVLSVGFAAGLTDDFAVGDLAFAKELCQRGDNYSDSIMLEAFNATVKDNFGYFASAGYKCKAAKFVTVDKVLSTSKDKIRTHKATGAEIADMESLAIWRTCSSLGVKWGGIRTVSDWAQEDLVLDFNKHLDKNGNPKLASICFNAAIHPKKWPALIKLGQTSSKSAENLAGFIKIYLDYLQRFLDKGEA